MSKVELIKAEERVEALFEIKRTCERLLARAEERYRAAFDEAEELQTVSAWQATDALYSVMREAEERYEEAEAAAWEAKAIAADVYEAERDIELQRILDARAESSFFGSVG